MSDANRVTAHGTHQQSGNRLIGMLSFLLVVQILLSAVLTLWQSKYQPVDTTTPMLSCDPDKISKIVIEEKQDNELSKIVLEKHDKGWVITEPISFVASASTISQLLKDLKELKKGDSTAATPDAADRFRVSAQNYAKAVHLFDDAQKETILYLGSSPRFRTVYARTRDSSNIYRVEFPERQVTAKTDEWIDHGAAKRNEDDISLVDMGTFELKLEQGKWVLVDHGKTTPLHEAVAKGFLNTITDLNINSALGTKDEPDYDMQHPVLSFSVTLLNGDKVSYEFSKPAGKPFFVLKISDHPWYFGVDPFVVNAFKTISAPILLKSEEATRAKERSRPSQREKENSALP